MAVLRVQFSGDADQFVELNEYPLTIGRQPSCEIVIDKVAVSRQHARIAYESGLFYLEDLQSRNGTFVNDLPTHGRMKLRDRDQIRICDVKFVFYQHMNTAELMHYLQHGTPYSIENLGDAEQRDGLDSSSSIISTLENLRSGSFHIGNDPENVLKAILEISEAISKILDVEQLLPKILNVLFKIFPHADSGFFVIHDQQTNRNLIRASKHRLQNDEEPIPVSRTIIDRAMQTRSAILSADVQDDSRFQSATSLSELQVRSMICAPLLSQADTATGVVQLNTRDMNREFTKSDLELLVCVANQAAMALDNARLHEELLTQRDLERDIDFATQIQLGFLPREKPSVPHYEFADLYEAALGVGGDYYDYIPLPDGRLAITQGDVSGKGVPAALLMARLCSAVRYQLLAQPTMSLSLQALNNEIFQSGVGFRFITFVLLILDPRTHELSIASAGHLPPVLRKKSGETSVLGSQITGIPLGIMPDSTYDQATITLSPGDMVVVYTDGITEAMNTKNEIFGRERLEDCIEPVTTGPNEAIRSLIDATNLYSSNQPIRDDRCLVAFRYIPDHLSLDGSTMF